MYTHIFSNAYIFLYLWPGQQTNQNVKYDPTHKKIGATNQRKDAPTLFMFIYFFNVQTPSEDHVYIFILVEVFDKVSRNVIRGHTAWFIKEPTASPLDLRHRPRICQKFMNVEHVYIRQCRRHGTTIHTYCFIQAEAELDGIHRYTLNQVALVHISSNGRVQQHLCIHIGIMYAVVLLTAPLQVWGAVVKTNIVFMIYHQVAVADS